MRFKYTGEPVIIQGSQIMIDNEVSPQEVAAIAKKQGETDDTLLKDLKPVKYWLCSVGSNNNLDYWGLEEMTSACHSIVYKPININHTRLEDKSPNTIIGVSYASEIKDNPEKKENKQSIFAKAYLYSYLYNKNTSFQTLTENIDAGKAYASMECAFTEYDVVHPMTGELLTGIETEEQFEEAKKKKKAARKFCNPMFIGSAFLIGVPPADPYCAIIVDDPDTKKSDGIILSALSRIFDTLKSNENLFVNRESDILLQVIVARALWDEGIPTEICYMDDMVWIMAMDGKKYRISSDGIRNMEGGIPKVKIPSSYAEGSRTLVATLCNKEYLEIFDKIR